MRFASALEADVAVGAVAVEANPSAGQTQSSDSGCRNLEELLVLKRHKAPYMRIRKGAVRAKNTIVECQNV